MLITAKEAREIAQSIECLHEIHYFIRKAARNGNYNVNIGFRGEKADIISKNVQGIKSELEHNGYEILNLEVDRSYSDSCVTVKIFISWRGR